MASENRVARRIWSWRVFIALSLSILLHMFCAANVAAQTSSYDDFIFAVKFDDAPTVQRLILDGADANSVEPLRGESALMIAMREKSTRVIDVLLSTRNIHLEARARNGDTALMLASFLGNASVVKKSVNLAGQPFTMQLLAVI